MGVEGGVAGGALGEEVTDFAAVGEADEEGGGLKGRGGARGEIPGGDFFGGAIREGGGEFYARGDGRGGDAGELGGLGNAADEGERVLGRGIADDGGFGGDGAGLGADGLVGGEVFLLEKIGRRDARGGGDEGGVFGFDPPEEGAIFGRGGEEQADFGRWRRDGDARGIDDLEEEEGAEVDDGGEEDEGEEFPAETGGALPLEEQLGRVGTGAHRRSESVARTMENPCARPTFMTCTSVS